MLLITDDPLESFRSTFVLNVKTPDEGLDWAKNFEEKKEKKETNILD